MTGSLDLSPAHRAIVERILAEHVQECEVRAFGSRVTWTARDSSDLDLAIVCKGPLDLRTLSRLNEAFEESSLPMRVDVLAWHSISESFREVIERDYVVVRAGEEANGEGGWIHCSLAEACSDINYGLTASASESPVGPRFLRITDIVSGPPDWNTVPFVAADDSTIEKYRLHDGDIVIARTGASTGTSSYVKGPPDSVFASYLVRLRAKPEFDSRFVSYYLKSSTFQDYMRGVLGDKSAQPNASASTMTAAPFSAPKSLSEQRNIAHILGTLDDKIELNRRMNQTLEEMARALFKSWFVDFDPVRAKAALMQHFAGNHASREADPSSNGAAPAVEWTVERAHAYLDAMDPQVANLFPDRLAPSELGEIPEGWDVKGLDDIATFTNGLALQRFPPDSDEWLPAIKIAEMRRGYTDKTGKASANLDPRYIVEDGDLLFSWSGSLELVFWTHGRGALNQHLFKVTSDDFPQWFYWGWTRMHLEEFRAIAAGKATTMGHIQRHHLTDAKVVVPPPHTVRSGTTFIGALVDQHVAHAIQSRAVAAQRQALLPRLLSNEICLQVDTKSGSNSR